MAAPASYTGYANNGKWVMNQKLSDGSDDILAAQGVGYLKRKAIGMTTVQVTNVVRVEGGVTVIKSSSSASGIPGAEEEIWLDGKERKNNHSIYGKIKSTATAKKPSEIDESYLTSGFLPDSQDPEGRIVYVHSVSDKEAGNKYDWVGIITSGFMEVDVGGKVERRWCRCESIR